MTHFESLQRLTQTKFRELRLQFPGYFDLGGCLLLGRQYAHPASHVLVLGINPGASPSTDLDVRRQEHDYLLSGPDHPRNSYWTNARKFFNASPVLLDATRLATFSFCCPYRTRTWSSLPKSIKGALAASSSEILQVILRDCSPELIIVTGVDGFRLFVEILSSSFHMKATIGSGGDGRLHQWAGYRAVFDGRELIVAQVPHFSRANEMEKLRQCAAWLGRLITPPARS